MLIIHKPLYKKLFFLVITSIGSIGVLLGLSVLTYTPELSHAETVTYKKTLANIKYMQDVTAETCANTPEADSQGNNQYQLVDKRDNKTYWVAKLKDGNCWMTQNLAFDLKTTEKLTNELSDVGEDGWTPPEDTQIGTITKFPSYDYEQSQKNTYTFSHNPGEYVYTTPIEQHYCGSSNKQLAGCINWELVPGLYTDHNKDERAHYLAGNYYSYNMATAGVVPANLESAGTSICPKGWTLPTGGDDGQMSTLIVNLTASVTNTVNNIKLAPYYFVYSGDVTQYAVESVGNRGYAWSATMSWSSIEARQLSFTTTTPADSWGSRTSGLPVRCVARTESEKTLSDLTYMQDMTMEVCKNSNLNESKQLIDKRDNKTYWVTKLKDNNCWMTQNLALDLDTTKPLTSELSDVSSNWTPPANTQLGTITKFPSGSDLTFSYNPGEYIYTTPMKQNYCGNRGITKLEGCPNWTLVTGLSKDTSGNEQSHYLAGNYYSYEVATVGTGPNTKGESAANSICPKGWTLPTGGTSDKQYGILVSGLTASTTDTTNNIKSAPYYFVYGGDVNSSSLEYAGGEGNYWSSTANNSDDAYFLFFGTSVSPSYSSTRHYSNSVRCVSPGGEKVIVNNDNIKITINPQLSLDVANEVIVEKSDANPSTAALPVSVASNQPYSVKINAKDNSDLTSSTTNISIPSNGGSLNTAINNWGIMKPNDTTYTKVTTTPELFYQATSPEAKDILFTIGISTAPDLPNGEYSTDITVTATQN